jgi:hypothetical protein
MRFPKPLQRLASSARSWKFSCGIYSPSHRFGSISGDDSKLNQVKEGPRAHTLRELAGCILGATTRVHCHLELLVPQVPFSESDNRLLNGLSTRCTSQLLSALPRWNLGRSQPQFCHLKSLKQFRLSSKVLFEPLVLTGANVCLALTLQRTVASPIFGCLCFLKLGASCAYHFLTI